MRKLFFSLILVYSANLFATNYYVNNASLVGDVYCTALGSAANSGLTPALPKATINQILTAYSLGPGDVIFVDAGLFTENLAPGTADNGTVAGFVKIVGAGASKTSITSNVATNTILLLDSKYIWIEGMTIDAKTSDISSPVYIKNNADNNVINLCVIIGPTSGTIPTSGGNYAISLESISSGSVPDNNSILSNTISANDYGIFCAGFSTGASDRANGNVFADNIIDLSAPSTNSQENSNYFYFTNNTQIIRNRFQNFYSCIYFSKSSGSTVNDNLNGVIANNYLTDNVNSSIHCGIHIQTQMDASANLKIYNNSFYFKDACFGVYHCGHGTGALGVSFMNNLISIVNVSGSYIYRFDLSPGTNKFDAINYNFYDCYLITNIAVGGFGNPTTLAAWKAIDHDAGATNGDVNSSDANITVGFVSPTTGNLNLSAASSMYSKCLPYNSLANDINSLARPTTPIANPHAFGAFDRGTVFLPIELIYFKGAKSNSINNLTWATATEINNNYFEVEKSDDGYNFTKIATLKSLSEKGNSQNKLTYEFNDEPGSAYYRLKQVDFDNRFKYTPIIYLENDLQNTLPLITPNPAFDKITISYYSQSTTLAIITLSDVSGRVLITKTADFNLDNHEVTLDIQNLNSGIYFLTIDNGYKIVNQKIVKE